MTLKEYLNEDIRNLKPRKKTEMFDLKNHPEVSDSEWREEIDTAKERVDFLQKFKKAVETLEKNDFITDAYYFFNKDEYKSIKNSIENLILLKNKISKKIPGATLTHSIAKQGKAII